MKNQTLPDWYNSPLPVNSSPLNKKRRAGIYVRRALGSLGEVLAQEMSTAPCVESWLGKLEPRAKLIGILLVIFGISFVNKPASLAVLFLLIIIAIISIRLPFKKLLRIGLGVPLFSLSIILPAITNFIVPGKPVFDLWHFGRIHEIGFWTIPETLSITSEGIRVSLRFLLRSIDSVTLVYLLISTTDPSVMLNGLRRLGMPKTFGMVMTMMQRYLSVLLRVAEEMHLAKISRTVAVESVRSEQKWAAAGIGMLFQKSNKLAYEVQNAMLSRGYDGDLQTGQHSSFHKRDAIFLMAIICLIALLVLFDCRWSEILF